MEGMKQQRHNEFLLEQQLRAYAAQDLYPMHMPGHKRQQVRDLSCCLADNRGGTRNGSSVLVLGEETGGAAGLLYNWDVTEVPETDDLHDAQGILREAMDRTAALYGVVRTWYLVNGSTCGLLAGIRSIAPYGSEVIVARNCHKAVYHAIELQNLTVHWIWPSRNREFDIYESVDPASVAALLEEFPETAAVVLTSPTYEGVVSDISAIAQICHTHCTDAHPEGVPLLVDEAHGAHLGFHAAFPDSAIHQGADLVVQSPHKTLPSLTQTAWMHLGQETRVTQEAVEQQLDIFETSSPSYPLMASLDGCTGILREHGEALFATYAENLRQIIRPAAEALQHLRVFGYGLEGRPADATRHAATGMCARDPGKILLSGRGCELDGVPCTGRHLADLLRDTYRIETEMHLGWNVLAMTSFCDTREGMGRLAAALIDIDRRVTYKGAEETAERDLTTGTVLPIAEAMRAPAEPVSRKAAQGRVAAEYVYCYPPGIPVVVPGERITADILGQLDVWAAQGAQVHHSAGRDGYYSVLQECK